MSGVYIILIILLFLSLYFVLLNKEKFTQCQPECYTHNSDSDICSSISSRAGINPDEFKMVCPSDPSCVGKCIKMFTWTDNSSAGIPINIGNLKDENYKDYYFCTRCNECIDHFYSSMSLLNTPHGQQCTAPVF